MFCTHCGNQLEQHARFCSKCGQDAATSAAVASTASPAPSSAPPALPKTTEHDMNMHINILGWLLVASGILTAIGGMIVLFVGRILPRMPFPIEREIEVGVPFASWLLSLIGLFVLALAAATAAAGVGLLQYRSWARVFTIIVSVLMLFHFPVGTAIAVYAFWVLFSEEGQRYYKSRSESTMTASGT